MDFEWDPEKAKVNYRKHRVSFEEAKTVFHPAEPEIFEDEKHSDEEPRFVAIGFSQKSRALTVAFVRRDKMIRIISARRASKNELMHYGKAKDKKS
jgi:uncharacterized protein